MKQDWWGFLIDTSAITNLTAIGNLDLLPQLYGQVVILTAVYRELVDVATPVPGTLEIQSAAWVEVRGVTDRRVVEKLRNEARLGPGESEAIALVLETGAELLLIDERRGRAEADRLEIRITEVLGILVEAKRKELISSVKPSVDALISTAGFRVSKALYEQILQMVMSFDRHLQHKLVQILDRRRVRWAKPGPLVASNSTFPTNTTIASSLIAIYTPRQR